MVPGEVISMVDCTKSLSAKKHFFCDTQKTIYLNSHKINEYQKY